MVITCISNSSSEKTNTTEDKIPNAVIISQSVIGKISKILSNKRKVKKVMAHL